MILINKDDAIKAIQNLKLRTTQQTIRTLDAIDKLPQYEVDAKDTNVPGKWIPISERLPKNEDYILVSFENCTLPDIARYEEDEEGGAFYPGDEEESYSDYGLFVNAWMELPKPYKGE